jgi:enolase
VNNVDDGIASHIVGLEITDQIEIDHKSILLDGPPNKSNLGANAIFDISIVDAKGAVFLIAK